MLSNDYCLVQNKISDMTLDKENEIKDNDLKNNNSNSNCNSNSISMSMSNSNSNSDEKENNIFKEELSKCTISKLTIINNKKNSDENYTIEEWSMLFALNSPDELNQCKLLTSLKCGIPESIRGKIWLFLSKSFQLSLKFAPSMYDNCLLIKDNNAELAIAKDVNRTFLFNGNPSSKIAVSDTKLYNILKAYSTYDIEISYCQGINYIVATLLQCIGKEKYVFWLLVQLMNHYSWRNLYKNNTPKLLRMMDILKQKIKKALPDLYTHFIKTNDMEIMQFFFTHFFLTLFCYNTPIGLSLRVIDLFWVYEEKIIFDAIIALLSLQKEKMILMKNEELLSYIKSDLVFDTVKEYGVDKIINYSH